MRGSQKKSMQANEEHTSSTKTGPSYNLKLDNCCCAVTTPPLCYPFRKTNVTEEEHITRERTVIKRKETANKKRSIVRNVFCR